MTKITDLTWEQLCRLVDGSETDPDILNVYRDSLCSTPVYFEHDRHQYRMTIEGILEEARLVSRIDWREVTE